MPSCRAARVVDAARRAGAPAFDLASPFACVHLGCGAPDDVVATALAFPHAQVWAWDWRADVVAELVRCARHAEVANLVVQERRGPPEALRADGPLVDLVVVDRVFERVDDCLRAALAERLRSGLRPGGVVGVRYATLAGWAEVAPVVRTMRRIAAGHTGDPATRVPTVLAVLHQLRAAGAGYLTHRPAVTAWLDRLNVAPHAEIEREWLADEFRPVSHAWLEAALPGLRWLADAEPRDDAPEALARLFATVGSATARESLRDLATRPAHRFDVFEVAWP